MANFVTDGSSLPGTKTGGPNPAVGTNQQVTGAEFNELTGALSDIRTYINETANLQTFGGDPTNTTDSGAAFAAALAAMSNVGVLVIPQGTYKLATNTAIPAGVVLQFLSGAAISIAASTTLTINGNIDAPDNQQIFYYVSSTIAGVPGVATQPVAVADAAPCKYLTPYHFGAAGDGTTDDQLALNVCFNASTRVFIPPGTFVPIAQPIVASLSNYHIFGTGTSSIIKMSPVTGANPLYPNYTGGTVNDFQTGVLTIASVVPSSQQQFVEIDHIQFIGNKNIYTTNNQVNFAWVANMIYIGPAGNGPYTVLEDLSIHHCLFQHGQLDTVWGEANRWSFCDNTIIDWGYLTDTNHPGSIANLNVVQFTAHESTCCRNNLYQVAGGFGLSGAFIVCTDNIISEYLTFGIYPADEDDIRVWTIANNVVRTTLTENAGLLNYNATAVTSGTFSLPASSIAIVPLPTFVSTLFPDGGGTINVVSGDGVQTVTYTAFDGTTNFTGCSGGTGTVSVGAAVYTSETVPIGNYAGIIMGPDDNSTGMHPDPMPQGLVITGNQIWFDDDKGSHTAPYAAGIQVTDASCNVTGNDIVFNLTASTTGSNTYGLRGASAVYSPVMHFSSNKVTYIQTASTPSMAQCQGIASTLGGTSGLLLEMHSSNNKVFGLAPSGNTAVGVAFNYSAVGAGSGCDLLCYMSGDFADGGTVLNGSIFYQPNVPVYLATDSRAANLNSNKRIDAIQIPALVPGSVGSYLAVADTTAGGMLRQGDLAGFIIGDIVLSSGAAYTANANITPASVISATRQALIGPTTNWGALSGVPVPAWVPGTYYIAYSSTAAVYAGQFVSNGGNIYQCYTTGYAAASGGPTGTGGDITDGTAHWKYLGVGDPGFWIYSSNTSDADYVQAKIKPY